MSQEAETERPGSCNPIQEGVKDCPYSLENFLDEASNMYIFGRYTHSKTIEEVKVGRVGEKGLIRMDLDSPSSSESETSRMEQTRVE